jgi:hypothetical protein
MDGDEDVKYRDGGRGMGGVMTDVCSFPIAA